MEFEIQSIMLLDEVKKKLTKRMHLWLPLSKISQELVMFLGDNLKQNPGNTDIVVQVVDEEDGMTTKLKTAGQRIHLNDDLTSFLQEHEEIRLSLEVS